jgi:hypothetical protein
MAHANEQVPEALQSSSPLESGSHRIEGKISDDQVALVKLANIYHWRELDGLCDAGNCPGYDQCPAATDFSVDGLKAVVDAVQTHYAHILLRGLRELGASVREILTEDTRG